MEGTAAGAGQPPLDGDFCVHRRLANLSFCTGFSLRFWPLSQARSDAHCKSKEQADGENTCEQPFRFQFLLLLPVLLNIFNNENASFKHLPLASILVIRCFFSVLRLPPKTF